MTSLRLHLSPKSISNCVIRLTLALLSLVSLVAVASAQNLNGATPLGVAPGTPVGSYALSGFDNVNLFNGNLNFSMPMLEVGGRGGVRVPLLLPIEQKWGVHHEILNGIDYGYFATSDWWNSSLPMPRYSLGSMFVRYAGDGATGCMSPDYTLYFTTTLTRLTFVAPDGTEYELRDQLTGGEPKQVTSCPAPPLYPPWGFNRGKVFVSADGSAMTFISDENIYDYTVAQSWSWNYISGYLILRDGTRYRIDLGSITWIRDRNGNKITFAYNENPQTMTIADSLNRRVTVEYDVTDVAPYGFCDRITISGFGGLERKIRISKKDLSEVLRSGYTPGGNVFPELSGMAGGNYLKFSALWLPDGRSYRFLYNPYGDLARVELPTGGAIEYDHTGGVVGGPSSGVLGAGTFAIYRRVVERRIYREGNVLESRQTFSRPEYFVGQGTAPGTLGYVIVDQYDGATPLTRSKHYFNGNAAMSMFRNPADYSGFTREYKTELFDVNPNGTTTLKKTIEYTFAQRAPIPWMPGCCSGLEGPGNDPRLIDTVTTLADTNQVTRQTAISPVDGSIGFDRYNNQTDMWEYDYGTGTPGALVRHNQTAFVTTNTVDGVVRDYACDPTTTCGNNVVIGNVIHLRNLPARQSTYDAGGVERARTTYEYDDYVTAPNHVALTAYSNISGLDAAFTSSLKTRGNLTGTTRYLLANGTVTNSITAYAQYDIAGNLVKTIDARGYATTADYSDCFGSPDGNARLNSGSMELNQAGQYSYALPTLVTNALGHNACAQFDYYTGRPVDGEDPNGIVASGYSTNEPLDRPTRVIRAANQPTPVQSQTSYSYDDPNRTITSTSDQTQFNDNALKGQSVYDGLGRTIEARTYEGGSNYIAVRTQYDALGRAFKVSNPFRPWKSETPVWTTSAFDGLGRLITVTTPDGAVVSTAYSGDRVLVTDQNGKQRISRTNALGQVKDVWEVKAAESGVTETISFPGHTEVTAGYRTSYSYDVVGNLVQVTQGSQQRFFAYDSLSRLTRARNPEQAVNTNLPPVTDPVSGNSQWSMAYTYDNNGNLLTRIDARNITTSYAYDALNRNTSITYTNDPSNTPAVTSIYDGATKGIGRFWKTETNSQASGSRTSIDSYDVMARPLSMRQEFSSGVGEYQVWKSYGVQRGYDLAGHVTSQTYPSGHSVYYTYDSAGRTSTFTGNLGEGVTRTYANEFQYTSWNSLEQEKFGTDTPLYHKQRQNIRGQLWDMRLGTTTDPANGDRGAIVNHYSNNFVQGGSGADNNGNLLRQEINIPGSGFFQDNFTYDSLNRLTSISEKLNGADNDTFKQTYSYLDRWGNRTIDAANTFGVGINNRQFTVDAATNRLGVPQGQTGAMGYDNAGNLNNDTYTGAGQRTFDAENRMTSADTGVHGKGGTIWAYYTYNGDGQRVRRKTTTFEIWQVYGMDGELVAEYPQTGPSLAVAQPTKEYGYRNGQLLVTAEQYQNVAWNKPATQTDDHAPTTTANKAVDGDVDGALWDNYSSATNYHPNSWWQVDLQSVQSISSITVWGRTDCCPEMTSDFYVFVSDNPFTSTDLNTTLNQSGVSNYYHSGFAGPSSTTGPTSINVNRTGRYVRVQLATTQYLVLGEVQVWSQAAKIEWLVADQLGTPRMIVDKTGSTSGISRHDYLPFGEDIFAGTGGRTIAQGYTANDGVRQQFTAQERDNETGLDYFVARYYGSSQGRFTGVDPFLGSGRSGSPQSWNRYAYAFNNPLRYIDPSGMDSSGVYSGDMNGPGVGNPQDSPEEKRRREQQQFLKLQDENRLHAQANDLVLSRDALGASMLTASTYVAEEGQNPPKPASDKPTKAGIVFTEAVIWDDIRDDAEITIADFTPNFDQRSSIATFEFGSDSKVCQGRPFSMSVKFRTGSSFKLRSPTDIGNKIDTGRDSQFKNGGGGLSVLPKDPPHFGIRLIRVKPDNPGRTINVTARGDNQFGPVSASAFVKINCP